MQSFVINPSAEIVMVRCLVETGMKVHPDISRALEEEEAKGEGDEVTDDGSLPDKNDSTVAPVHEAAQSGHVSILKMFIDSGIDVELRDEFGRTLFIVAAHSNQPKAMEFLLAQGADPTARIGGNNLAKQYFEEFAGADALEVIARHGDAKMVEMLLQKLGVKTTPLSVTAAAGSNNGYKILHLLLESARCLAPAHHEFIVAGCSTSLKQAALDAIPLAIPINDLDSIKLLLGFRYPELAKGNIADYEVSEELHKSFVYGAYSTIVLNHIDKFDHVSRRPTRGPNTQYLTSVRYRC
jgi:hypothetical protein